MRHKFDADMSSDCTKELTRRQLLISEDWKASKGLVVNCRKDVKQNQCLNQARTDALSFKHGNWKCNYEVDCAYDISDVL